MADEVTVSGVINYNAYSICDHDDIKIETVKMKRTICIPKRGALCKLPNLFFFKKREKAKIIYLGLQKVTLRNI